jgi:hypothetical protein
MERDVANPRINSSTFGGVPPAVQRPTTASSPVRGPVTSEAEAVMTR